MKLVESIVSIKNFFLRKNIMGLVLLLAIGLSSLVTSYRHHLFDNWVAHTNAVTSANAQDIEKLKTVVVAKPVAPVPAVVPPVVIVEKVVVPAKTTHHPKHHGILKKGTPLSF